MYSVNCICGNSAAFSEGCQSATTTHYQFPCEGVLKAGYVSTMFQFLVSFIELTIQTYKLILLIL
jgi:hypothetical protein